MTTVTLAALMRERDESIASMRTRPHPMARIRSAWHSIPYRPALRMVAAFVLALAQFGHRHGLVLSGCCAAVVAASTLSATAAWIMTALAFFFLEARRR